MSGEGVVWRVSGSMTTGAVGSGIGSGSSPVNDYAAENDRGCLALVASLPKNTSLPENTSSDDIS